MTTVRRGWLCAVALLVTIGLAGCGGSSTPATPRDTGTPALHGAVPAGAPAVRPTFRLVDTTGAPYDFGRKTGGRVTFLYFGYTHCPDECPTSMADVAAALRRTDPAVADQVDVVFVTTDPWRDTAPALRTWLDRFSPSFIGLTGRPSQIAGAEVALGMPISRRVPDRKRGHGRYSVDHFAAVMVFGRDDRLATLYPSGVSPGEIAADIPVLVKG